MPDHVEITLRSRRDFDLIFAGHLDSGDDNSDRQLDAVKLLCNSRNLTETCHSCNSSCAASASTDGPVTFKRVGAAGKAGCDGAGVRACLSGSRRKTSASNSTMHSTPYIEAAAQHNAN